MLPALSVLIALGFPALAQDATPDAPPPQTPAEAPVVTAVQAPVESPVEVIPLAQIRPRAEQHSGRDSAAGGNAFFVSHRARLGLIFRFENLEAKVVLQDVRNWGAEDSTTDYSAEGFDAHEAWFMWSPSDTTSIKVGRQEMNMHGQRLVGSLNWAQQARAFDAVSVHTEAGPWSLDAVATILGEQPVNAEGYAFFLRTGLKFDPILFDVLVTLDRDDGIDQTRVTAGAWTKITAGIFDLRLEGYFQGGPSGAGDISAYMAGVSAKLSPEVAGKPTFTLWYDLLSGDQDMADGTNRAFNGIWGTNHKFYGIADIAYFKVGGPADGRGLHDGALKVGFKPIEGLSLGLDGHVFLAAADQNLPGLIGGEVDLYGKYAINKHLTATGGGAMFIPESGQVDHWMWLMLDAKL